MRDFIKKTLKIDFISCKLINILFKQEFEFTLKDNLKTRMLARDVMYTLNNRNSKIQFDMVAICKYLLHDNI